VLFVTDASSARDAETAAEQTLVEYWNLGAQTTVPVDPIFIAQQMGIQVWVADLEDGVAGMLVNRPPSEPEIYLRSDDARNRQRFTCAHELGHYVKRQEESDGDSWAYVDRRDQLSGRGSDVGERYANNFAACLLMPDSELKRLMDHITPSKLAMEFGVSTEAMNYRIANVRNAMPNQ
jgi:Zn-dependent peptidase ImmA (M78 family)